mgnify:CR=1 FL=1
MTQDKSFEELFPSLIGFRLNVIMRIDVDYDIYSSKDIQRYCIDKQKVRDAKENLHNALAGGAKDTHAFEDFEKELGL